MIIFWRVTAFVCAVFLHSHLNKNLKKVSSEKNSNISTRRFILLVVAESCMLVVTLLIGCDLGGEITKSHPVIMGLLTGFSIFIINRVWSKYIDPNLERKIF